MMEKEAKIDVINYVHLLIGGIINNNVI